MPARPNCCGLLLHRAAGKTTIYSPISGPGLRLAAIILYLIFMSRSRDIEFTDSTGRLAVLRSRANMDIENWPSTPWRRLLHHTIALLFSGDGRISAPRGRGAAAQRGCRVSNRRIRKPAADESPTTFAAGVIVILTIINRTALFLREVICVARPGEPRRGSACAPGTPTQTPKLHLYPIPRCGAAALPGCRAGGYDMRMTAAVNRTAPTTLTRQMVRWRPDVSGNSSTVWTETQPRAARRLISGPPTDTIPRMVRLQRWF